MSRVLLEEFGPMKLSRVANFISVEYHMGDGDLLVKTIGRLPDDQVMSDELDEAYREWERIKRMSGRDLYLYFVK